MRPSVAIIAFICSFLPLTACHDANPAKSSVSATDRGRVCVDGGGVLSATSDECTCPQALHWTGARCEADEVAGDSAKPADKLPAPPALTDTKPPEADEATQAEDPTAESETPAPDISSKTSLRADCAAAGAHFDAKDGYCYCKGGDVLIGTSCRAMAGQITEQTCKAVRRPGHWQKNRCECANGKTFIPGRGGCVVKRKLSITSLRRMCESSINRGKWDARTDSCDCGDARLWSGALCELRAGLSSREICEGAQQGAWDSTRKRCDCPAGGVWMDQICKPAATVDALAACVSEANGGRWVSAEGHCACPSTRDGRASTWDAVLKVCK